MIITFSERYASAPSHQPLEDTVLETVDHVSQTKYRLTWQSDSPIGNVYAQITWSKARRVRFTLGTRDSRKYGSRRSAAGRHMPKASWEAHRDIMEALFDADPDARIKTALATYRGRKDFHSKFPTTAHKNIGSIMHPCTMRETTVL